MTTVRIAHAEPQPGRLANGAFITRGFLVVLSDDAGHRAVPVWLRGEPGAGLAGQPGGEIITAAAPQELTGRLLGAAGARVTGVDLELTVPDATELSPQAAAARIWLAGPAGSAQVSAGLALGLAMAAAAGAPVRVAGTVLDRVAVPVAGQDLLSPFLDRLPPDARVLPDGGLPGWPWLPEPRQRPRFEPRNLDFADGLDRWDLDLGPRREPGSEQPGDYAAAAEGRSALLSSAVPRPAGPAALLQAVYADDYRGSTVTFGGEIRTGPRTVHGGLRLEILTRSWAAGHSRRYHGVTVPGGTDWARHEISAPVPDDADLIRFGLTLAGHGRVALRNPGLRAAAPAAGR